MLKNERIISIFETFMTKFHELNEQPTYIGIKHDFPFINIPEGGFQHLPKDLVNVNEWQNHVWSLLLHKFKENTLKIEKMFVHFILQPYHHFLTHTRFL